MNQRMSICYIMIGLVSIAWPSSARTSASTTTSLANTTHHNTSSHFTVVVKPAEHKDLFGDWIFYTTHGGDGTATSLANTTDHSTSSRFTVVVKPAERKDVFDDWIYYTKHGGDSTTTSLANTTDHSTSSRFTVAVKPAEHKDLFDDWIYYTKHGGDLICNATLSWIPQRDRAAYAYMVRTAWIGFDVIVLAKIAELAQSQPLLLIRFVLLHGVPIALLSSASFDDTDNMHGTFGQYWALALRIEVCIYIVCLLVAASIPRLRKKLWNPRTKYLSFWTMKLATGPIETLVWTSWWMRHTRRGTNCCCAFLRDFLLTAAMVSPWSLLALACVQWVMTTMHLAKSCHALVAATLTYVLNCFGQVISATFLFDRVLENEYFSDGLHADYDPVPADV